MTHEGLALHTLISECVTDCELVDAIEALSKSRQVRAKHILFRQGEPPSRLFLLRTGEVVLTSRRADKSVLGFRAAPGSLIGLSAIAGNQPCCMTATVTKNSDLHAISIETFRGIVENNPRLSSRVLQVLASELRSARFLYIDHAVEYHQLRSARCCLTANSQQNEAEHGLDRTLI
jgi:CRP-like cAMP-binding protein